MPPNKRRFDQVYAEMRSRIGDGRLPLASRLPPSRALANEMGVSRTTVVSAYEQLIAEGYLEGRQGSGYFVRSIGSDVTPAPTSAPFALRRTGSASLSGPRPFRPGVPDLRCFPKTTWARAVARVARTDPSALYAPVPAFGDLRLRSELARYLAEWRGVKSQPEQIMITAGAADGVDLCLRTLLAVGDTVGLENPGYPPLRAAAASLGLSVVDLPIDELGATLPPDPQSAPLVVLTPSHQFPLGGAMSADRRAAYLQWAEANGSYILEDDYDSEFRYAGQPIPALQSYDTAGRIIYAGTLSKVFSVGLRLGYLVLPHALIEPFEQALVRFGSRASVMPQRPLAEFLACGDFIRHIRRMRRLYGDRRRHLMAAVSDRLADTATIIDHPAGMAVVVRLPATVDDIAIQRAAHQEGIVLSALSSYYSSAATARSGLLLGSSAYQEAEMDAALPILVDQIRRASG